MHGCTSPRQCRTALHFVGTAPAVECSRRPEPVRSQQSAKHFFFSLYLLCLRVYVCVTLTLTNGKAGPGAKGSFSCSIWYLRYSSTPSCSNTFCSRSVRNKTREETAMVTAFSGFGCRKRGETRQKLVRWSEKGR